MVLNSNQVVGRVARGARVSIPALSSFTHLGREIGEPVGNSRLAHPLSLSQFVIS